MSMSMDLGTDGAALHGDSSVRHLGDIMRTRVVTIGANDSAAAAWTRMRRRGIRQSDRRRGSAASAARRILSALLFTAVIALSALHC